MKIGNSTLALFAECINIYYGKTNQQGYNRLTMCRKLQKGNRT